MSKEKKSKAIENSDSQRRTQVLLEEIRSEVKTVSEQHGSIMDKLKEHDQKFENIESRLDKIDLKLISHDRKFEEIDEKFVNLEGRFDRIENVITGVMSDHETRIKKLEEKVTTV